MNKKLQVFVSSTYIDLIEERQTAVQTILDAGHIPAGMELFKAGKSQMKTIFKWIDESDVYMLILGGRYGSIEEESGLSYTELEYNYALSIDIPVFAIVLDDSFLHTKAASKGALTIFEKENINKYNEFKTYVKNKVVHFPKNLDQISTIIHSNLNEISNDTDYNLVGWTRQYTNEEAAKIINENNLLKKQIQKLQDELNNIRISRQTQNNKIKTGDFSIDLSLFFDDPSEEPFYLLKQILASKKITYGKYTHSALDFFKRRHFTSSYIQEDSYNSVFLYFEKYGLVTRKKSKDFNLYIFSLSERGTKFYKYLIALDAVEFLD